MLGYIIRRILLMIPTLIGAGLLVFMLMRMIPGDVCEIRLGGAGLTVDKEQIDICRDNLGLNQSMTSSLSATQKVYPLRQNHIERFQHTY